MVQRRGIRFWDASSEVKLLIQKKVVISVNLCLIVSLNFFFVVAIMKALSMNSNISEDFFCKFRAKMYTFKGICVLWRMILYFLLFYHYSSYSSMDHPSGQTYLLSQHSKTFFKSCCLNCNSVLLQILLMYHFLTGQKLLPPY